MVLLWNIQKYKIVISKVGLDWGCGCGLVGGSRCEVGDVQCFGIKGLICDSKMEIDQKKSKNICVVLGGRYKKVIGAF